MRMASEMPRQYTMGKQQFQQFHPLQRPARQKAKKGTAAIDSANWLLNKSVELKNESLFVSENKN